MLVFASMQKENWVTLKGEAFNSEGLNPPLTFLLVKSSKRCSSKFSARMTFLNINSCFLSAVITHILGFYQLMLTTVGRYSWTCIASHSDSTSCGYRHVLQGHNLILAVLFVSS